MSRKLQQGKRNTELLVPPDKRRKTDLNMAPHCQTNAAGPDELWDDDDDMDDFTQDQLEDIDNLIASSQQVDTGQTKRWCNLCKVLVILPTKTDSLDMVQQKVVRWVSPGRHKCRLSLM